MIELQDVWKVYMPDSPYRVEALKGINLKIRRGEIVGIMGPSGSGKSTLLHILGFLDRPTKGVYLFCEEDVSEKTEDELAKMRNEKVGFVFQNYYLLPRHTVLENVILPALYGRHTNHSPIERGKEVLRQVHLAHRLRHRPSELSGGEQQRVAIARALFHNPEILLADEPTGNLDSATGEAILDIFQQLNEAQKMTIVIVTHNPEIARICHRILVIRDGVIQKESVRVE
ncbi:MAG: ABC transporter ATP-binding protein [bacterium]